MDEKRKIFFVLEPTDLFMGTIPNPKSKIP
jgi:hypothetical protein